MDRTKDLQFLKSEVIDALNLLDKKASLPKISIDKHMSKILWQKPVSGADIDALSGRMTALSDKLSKLTQEGKAIASEQMLLRSLWFPAMREREENVARANNSTLHWIFEGMPPESFQGRHPNLQQWLEQENGIYWVRGKPGSGKSTLMKYLSNHTTTKKLLQTWASPKRSFQASHFFWCAGSKLQRSMKGLLQSLLYEVLRQCPELICHVYPDLDGMHYQSDYEPWSFAELQEAVQLLRQQQDASVRFCFFIDGLDEYDAESTEGTHAGLVRSLKTLAESPDIKLCVSSRPWTVFIDAFGRNPERMLALEDLNRGDIYSYVSSTFSQNQRFVELESQDRRYHEVIEEIVEKAQGVFLWVFLVVRSLESGLEHSDRISDLQRRLRLLPRDLKAFFRQILGNVDEVYQQQAAELFKMMLDTSSPISLMTLSLADEEDVDFAFKPHQPLTTVEIRDRQEIMRRRLDARCKGLVEVTKLPTQYSANGSHYFFSTKIDFLHRTVRDFLKNKEMEDFFERFTQDFNSHLVLAKSFLAQMKVIPVHNSSALGPREILLQYLAQCACRLEKGIEDYHFKILDEAEHALCMEAQAYLGFLAQCGLARYLERRIESRPGHLREKRPLLDYALNPQVEESSDRRVIRTNVVEVLLKLGADPNQRYEDSTVWGHFAQKLNAKESVFDLQSLFYSTLLLLQHNADPAKSVLAGWQKRQGGGRTGRASDIYGSAKLPLYLKAIDVIGQCEFFTAEQRKDLLLISRQQTVGFKNWPRLLLNRAFWIGAGRLSR